MSDQTASANWARQVPMYRRMIERLRAVDVQCEEPPDFETPPHKRGLPLHAEPRYSTGMGAVVTGTDGTSAPHPDRTLEDRT